MDVYVCAYHPENQDHHKESMHTLARETIEEDSVTLGYPAGPAPVAVAEQNIDVLSNY